MSQKNQILKYFSRSHATHLHARGEFGTMALIQQLDCQVGDDILELGCGTGATLMAMAALYPKSNFFGVDQSALMLEKTNGRLKFCGLAKRVFLKQTDAGCALPFEDNSFDRIYVESMLAIQQGKALPRILAEIKRILKPQGTICFNETIWAPEISLEELKSINAICLSQFGIIQANEVYPYLKDWQQLLKQLDFEIETSLAVDGITISSPPIIPFLTAFRSKLFTAIGKLKGRLASGSKVEWKQYEATMNEIHSEGAKILEGTIFKAKNIK